MRLSIKYSISLLPLMYRMKIYGLIKEAIKLSDNIIYQQLFEANNDMKPFCFSVYLHNYKINDDQIDLESITLIISSNDPTIFISLYNGLRKIGSYDIEGYEMVRQSIHLLQESHITKSKVHFRTLSPILIENKSGQPLHPHHEDYQRELNYFANLKVEKFLGRSLIRPIIFTPLNMKKNVIKERNRYIKNGESLIFTTYSGNFILEGDPSDLQLLYQLGLGKRTVFYGLLEVVREEV